MPYDAFITYIGKELKMAPHTVRAYRGDLEQFRAFCAADTGSDAPEDVDTGVIRRWIASLVGGGVSPRSMARKESALRTFFDFLTRRRGLAANPMEGIHNPKLPRVLPQFVPESQMQAVVDSMVGERSNSTDFADVRNALIVTMLYTTGMRAAELISLRDAAVDTSAGELKVLGKRNKERVIPFGPELREMINRYRTLRHDTVGHDTDTFFVRPDGRPLYYMLVWRAVKEILDEAAVSSSRRSPHVLRHTFATDMINGGADLGAVQKLLGHASLATTQQYIHLSYRELQKNYQQAHPRAQKRKET